MPVRARALAALALALLSAGCTAEPRPRVTTEQVTDARVAPGEVLVIGSVDDHPDEEAELYQPFADHLASRLAPAGVGGADIVVVGTVREMVELLRAGEVDLYVDSVYPAARAVDEGVATPLARRWKNGAATYHSVVVARRGSGVSRLEDLAGKTVALEDHRSTDGYFLPVTALLDAGLPVREVQPDSRPEPGQVGYVFTGDEENALFAVLSGQVAAAGVSEEGLEGNLGPRADEVVVVGRSPEVPRQAVVARADLAPALRDATALALSGLHLDDEGRRVLDAFEGTERFDPLTAEELEPVVSRVGAVSP